VSIAIDDFGTGYPRFGTWPSSGTLAQDRRSFIITMLKIRRS